MNKIKSAIEKIRKHIESKNSDDGFLISIDDVMKKLSNDYDAGLVDADYLSELNLEVLATRYVSEVDKQLESLILKLAIELESSDDE